MDQETTATVASQARTIEAAGATGAWRLDPADAEVRFSVKKFWGLVTVRGSFGDVRGGAQVAAAGSITGDLVIGAASVDTGQAKRDEHLRSGDFFDVEHFPEMRVRIDAVDLAAPDRGTARGVVTVLGQTRPVEVPVAIAIEPEGTAAVVTGEVTLDRSAFGMTWSPLRMASMDVVVSVHLGYRAAAD